MMSKRSGFTLIELMVVILIIGVLAGVIIPLMQARADRAKWSEANAAAGMLRTAAKVAYMKDGIAVTGSLGEAQVQAALHVLPTDITGTYFVPGDYEILSVNSDGIAVIKVTGSQPKAPSGSRTLTAEGDWQ